MITTGGANYCDSAYCKFSVISPAFCPEWHILAAQNSADLMKKCKEGSGRPTSQIIQCKFRFQHMFPSENSMRGE